MYYYSPTKGRLHFNQVFENIMEFIQDDPDSKFKLIVGTDSQYGEEVCYVTAIIILREGKGGRFFYSREREKVRLSFNQRILMEASRSLAVAALLAEKMAQAGVSGLNVEIHLDVGENGKTKEIIREVVGMVTGSGFGAIIKPDSFGASKVADRYTK
ncbi:MAG TPA: ribonuclease H-like YkuK family protein [Bacillota bacterium]